MRNKITNFNSDPVIKIFGTLDYEIFTQSLALNVSGDCTNRHQLNLTNADCKDNWQKTTECIRLAIDFVKNLGVQQLSIIPYSSLLAVIQHYFFLSGEKYVNAEVKNLISGWFWTVTFSQRYSSSTLTRMNEDVLWINELANGDLKPRLFAVKLTVDELLRVRMNLRSVIKNGILCLMALNGPLDFDNGAIVTLDKTNASRSNSKENHHFFPYALRQQFGITQNEVNSVLNFAFISKRLNQQISAKHPNVYLRQYESENEEIQKALLTHFIDKKAFAAAKNDNFREFVTLRGTSILNMIQQVCHTAGEQTTIQMPEADDEPEKLYLYEDENY